MLPYNYQYLAANKPGLDPAHPGLGAVAIDPDGFLTGTSGNPIYVITNAGSTEYLIGTLIVDQGLAGTPSQGWLVKLTDGTNVLGTDSHPLVTTSNFSASLSLPPALRVIGAVAITGAPVDVNATLNLPPVLQVGGMVGISGNPQVTAVVSIPQPLTVQGMIGISGNPQITSGPLPGATYPVTGAITISGTPAVSVAFPATQNVNLVGYPNPLTVNGLVGLSGSPTVTVAFPSTQVVAGIITVSGTPTVIVSNFPANQLVTASPLGGATFPVTGSVTLSGTPAVSVAFPATQNVNVIGIEQPLTIQGAVTLSGSPAVTVTFPTTQVVAGVITVSGTPTVSVANFPATQNVNLIAYPNPLTVAGAISVSGALPAGANVIGHVISDAASLVNIVNPITLVTGMVGLSGSPAVTVTFPNTQTVAGLITISGTPSVSVSNFPATQNVALVAYANPLTVNGAVSVSGALPTGSNVIGHIIADTGSTTAVTGNVTIVQPTGTNLHVVVDTTSTTAVTQATGSNLHAVLDASTATIGSVNIVNPITLVTGLVGISGNPLVQAGPLAGATYPVTGAVTISGSPTVTVAFPATQNVNIVGYPNPLTVQGSVTLSGSPTVTASIALPPLTMVTGMVGISGNPQIIAGPLGGATYPVTGTVAISGSLPTGANVIGHVITDTGSTTVVTGNITVVQATGTNLHAVLDTTSTTAVTQATGTNLHAVIDTGSTTAVTGNVTVIQGTGTNLHTVTDTGSTTAVTGTVTVTGTVNNVPPPLMMVTGMVGISGTPSVSISNFPATQNVNVISYSNPLTVNGMVGISGSPTVVIASDGSIGSAAPATGILIAGQDGSSILRSIAVDASGYQYVNQGNPTVVVSGWPVKLTDGLNILGTITNPMYMSGPLMVDGISSVPVIDVSTKRLLELIYVEMQMHTVLLTQLLDMAK